MTNTRVGRTAGIILAAGTSSRLGQNKQLVTIGDRCVIQRIVDAATSSHLSQLFLVLNPGAQSAEKLLKDHIDKQRVTVIVNPDFQDGMSTSLKAGLEAALDFPSAMFLLGDQPFVDFELINTLLETFWRSECQIVAPTFQGRRRNPVIFGKTLYGEILTVSGDQGAREIIARHQNTTKLVEFTKPALFLDIDTRDDIDTARSISRGGICDEDVK